MKTYRIPKTTEIDLSTITPFALLADPATLDDKTRKTVEFVLVAAGHGKIRPDAERIAELGRHWKDVRKAASKLSAFGGMELPVDMLSLAGAPPHSLEGCIWLAAIRKPERFLEVLSLIVKGRSGFRAAMAETAERFGFDIESRQAMGLPVA